MAPGNLNGLAARGMHAERLGVGQVEGNDPFGAETHHLPEGYCAVLPWAKVTLMPSMPKEAWVIIVSAFSTYPLRKSFLRRTSKFRVLRIPNSSGGGVGG